MIAFNNAYEILTPDGWRDFKAVTQTEKAVVEITLAQSSVTATANHYFFNNDEKVQVRELCVGGYIDTELGPQQILAIENKEGVNQVYDIIEVDAYNHKFIINGGVITKNCDEFAFLQPNIAEEFWTSISPTLATGGRAIITSTPNSDEDTFATIWKQAEQRFDEHGNEQELGVNGFHSYQAHWSEHPDRDEKWKAEELGRIGEEKFRREYACVNAETGITLQDENGIEFKITMGKLYEMLEKDMTTGKKI